jgi:hypothetical protein
MVDLNSNPQLGYRHRGVRIAEFRAQETLPEGSISPRKSGISHIPQWLTGSYGKAPPATSSRAN